MSEPNGVDRALPGPDDLLEWVPDEVREAMRRPRFRRLTSDERMRVGGRDVPAAYLRQRRFTPRTDPSATPVPTAFALTAQAPVRQPRIDAELANRLAEVESVVSRAAEAVDRRAEHVQSLVAEAARTGLGKRPG